ncbi:MAG: hypothetical protein IJP00_03210 [Firmicutes bacterium]|nr:hypothetical protein [Bacillota bacterium]
MKEIKLVPDIPFAHKVDVAVIDFPEEGKERQRCKITVEYSKFDVSQLQKGGLDYKGALDWYEKRIYNVVKYHISQDWECVSGWEDVMGIVREKIKEYY